MKEQLQNKLHEQSSYTDDQLTWCLKHIGHPDPDIRDGLIYATFCHGFEEQLISHQQFLWLTQELLSQKLLASSETLTRSFSALLASLLLFCDNWEDSPYFSQLGKSRAELFNLSLDFLRDEKDYRGYDKELGWIHAIAHGAEFLMSASLHQTFPNEKYEELWQVIKDLFSRQVSVFSAGEPDRLAIIFTQLILAEKLSQNQLSNWVTRLNLPEQRPEEYFSSLNFKAFLTFIYMTLDKEEILSPTLKEAILKKF